MRLDLIDNFMMPEGQVLELLDVHPHLGLLALSAVVEEAGHQVLIHDPKRDVKTGELPLGESLYDEAADRRHCRGNGV